MIIYVSRYPYISHVTNEWQLNKALNSLIICNCHNYLHNYHLAMNQSVAMTGRLVKSCQFEVNRLLYVSSQRNAIFIHLVKVAVTILSTKSKSNIFSVNEKR